MFSGAVRRPKAAPAAFTLIELLLSVAVLLMLFGAVIISFGDMQSGARLTEGADRFETLLRLARAHASITGQKVRIDFVTEGDDPGARPLARVWVARETEPFEEPGVFELLTGPEWKLTEVNELVGVEEVGPLVSASEPSASEAAVDPFEEERPSIPWITFYPDGSSDSAQMILASREEDHLRRVEVRLVGITGEISRRLLAGPDFDLEEAEEAEDSDLDGVDPR